MRAVQIIDSNTKHFRIRGSKYVGEDLIIHHPYELNFKVIHEEIHEEIDGKWVKEVELDVEDRVWCEYEKDGVAFERVEETFFLHKNKIEDGLRPGDQNFLNAYKGRFLYARSDVANEKFAEYYILDNVNFNYKGMNQYKIKKLKDFKEFKNKLKELNLI
jgi:hypothetical protein